MRVGDIWSGAASIASQNLAAEMMKNGRADETRYKINDGVDLRILMSVKFLEPGDGARLKYQRSILTVRYKSIDTTPQVCARLGSSALKTTVGQPVHLVHTEIWRHDPN